MSDGIPTSAVTTRTITATFCHASEELEFDTIGPLTTLVSYGYSREAGRYMPPRFSQPTLTNKALNSPT